MIHHRGQTSTPGTPCHFPHGMAVCMRKLLIDHRDGDWVRITLFCRNECFNADVINVERKFADVIIYKLCHYHTSLLIEGYCYSQIGFGQKVKERVTLSKISTFKPSGFDNERVISHQKLIGS